MEKNENNGAVKKKSSFLKVYGIIILAAVILFFACSIIKLAINVANENSTINSSSLFMIVQFTIPILCILFGWVPALIISSSKSK